MTYTATLPDGREIQVPATRYGHPKVNVVRRGTRYRLAEFHSRTGHTAYRLHEIQPNDPRYAGYVAPWKRPEGEA